MRLSMMQTKKEDKKEIVLRRKAVEERQEEEKVEEVFQDQTLHNGRRIKEIDWRNRRRRKWVKENQKHRFLLSILMGSN